MADSTADQQRKALEDFNRLTFLFASRVHETGGPFPASDDFNDLHIREVFGRLEGLFSPGTWRVVVESEVERFLTSRTLGEEPISSFNSRVGRARQALLKEIRGQRWTWGRLAALLAFLAATGIPLYNFVHDRLLSGSLKEEAKVVPSPANTTATPKRASHRVKLAVHDVAAEGCENKAETFTVVSPSAVDTSAGGQGAAPAGWEFELTGNGSHGIRGVAVSGSTLSFTLHAEGGGTVQGGSLGIPKVCVGATGANSSARCVCLCILRLRFESTTIRSHMAGASPHLPRGPGGELVKTDGVAGVLRYPISATAAEKPMPRKGRESFPSSTSPVRPRRSPSLQKAGRVMRRIRGACPV